MNFKFKISKEDIFYYIYGLLNSNIYKILKNKIFGLKKRMEHAIIFIK